MATFFKRDMAGISDPSLLNDEVDGFEQKVNNALPTEAQYACKFWASHLMHVEFGDQAVVDAREIFCTQSILWWAEAMGLIGSAFAAAGCIQETQRRAVRVFHYSSSNYIPITIFMIDEVELPGENCRDAIRSIPLCSCSR